MQLVRVLAPGELQTQWAWQGIRLFLASWQRGWDGEAASGLAGPPLAADALDACRLDLVASTKLQEDGIQFLQGLTLLEHLDLGGFECVSDTTITACPSLRSLCLHC